MTDLTTEAASADVRRQVVRLCGIHTQASIQIALAATEQDLVSAMMFMAITCDNTQKLTVASQTTGAYSALDQIPPDDLRRPVSVYALARELGLAYETARRHANKLVAAGLAERSEEGLLIPAAVHGRPAMLKAVETNWDETLRFVRALAAFGVRGEAAAPEAPRDVRRQVVRLSMEFLLESLRLLTDAMEIDFLGALLCIAITRGNTQHLTEDPSAPYASLNEVPPDSLRKPVSVYALAKTLRLPYETTRRNVGQLVSAGYCDRMEGGGLIVPLRVLAIPSLMTGVQKNWQATQRFLNALAQLGVTAA
jgi:DNA-binding transcriptional ArsR family regulator